jgi:hypothetical protein
VLALLVKKDTDDHTGSTEKFTTWKKKMKLSKENGTYYFKDGDDIIYACDELGVSFFDDGYDFTLLKHGPSESIRNYSRKRTDQYKSIGIDGEIISIYSNTISPDDINYLLERCDRASDFLSKHGIFRKQDK